MLSVATVLVLQFESSNPDANIVSGGDALWWGMVTITTVGYGDFFPVTFLGRLTGVFVMFAGVGIIGSLASILASILVPDAPAEAAPEAAQPEIAPAVAEASGNGTIESELAAIRIELTAMRELLANQP